MVTLIKYDFRAKRVLGRIEDHRNPSATRLLPPPGALRGSYIDYNDLQRDVDFYKRTEHNRTLIERASGRGQGLTAYLERTFAITAESSKVKVDLQMLKRTPLEFLCSHLNDSGLSQWRKMPDFYAAVAIVLDQRMKLVHQCIEEVSHGDLLP